MMKKIFLAGFVSLAFVAQASAGPVEEMLDTDRAFAKMAAEKGAPAAFAAYAAEDVRMFPAGGQPYAGLDELNTQFSGWPDGAVLSWSPVEGVAAPGGDFGFTWGRYQFTPPPGEDGEAVNIGHGKYISIWRKEADGAWKFVADIGNANPAPETP